jgi:hypothetical protein
VGQGIYRMLGYGVIAPDEMIYTEEDARHRELLVKPLSDKVKTPYESKPCFMVLPLAVDDTFLQNEMRIEDLPHDAMGGSVANGCAKWIGVNTRKFSETLRASVAKAEDEWAVIHEAFQQSGITLPVAGFVLISDWD